MAEAVVVVFLVVLGGCASGTSYGRTVAPTPHQRRTPASGLTNVPGPVAGPCGDGSEPIRGQVVLGSTAGASHLYDAWGLRTFLAQRLPQAFGGLYGDHGTLVLLVTRGHQSQLEALKADFDRADPAGGRPTYRIDEASRTLARIEALRILLTQKTADLQAKGVVVTRWGPDDKANALSVGLLDDTAAARAAVTSALGACANEVQFSQQDVARPIGVAVDLQ